MAELTINQVIKIIIGILVVVAVVWGVYYVFNNRLLDFIKNIGGSGNNTLNFILALL